MSQGEGMSGKVMGGNWRSFMDEIRKRLLSQMWIIRYLGFKSSRQKRKKS